MCTKNTRIVSAVLGLIAMTVAQNLFAHTCPPGAVSTGVGIVLTAFRSNSVTHQLTPIGTGVAGACETIYLQAALSYVPKDAQGNTVAAFQNGEVGIFNFPVTTFSNNVTPVGGIPTIGPLESDAVCPCNCGVVTNIIGSRIAAYQVQPADVGTTITFFARYLNGDAHIGSNNLVGAESATTAIFVSIVAGPTCAVVPATQTVCPGASASFTATGSGPVQAKPYTFTWTGPNGFAQTNANVLSSTITIANAQAANAGTYTATVRDAFGCINTCSGTLIVSPPPTCTITPTNAVNCVSTNVYTSTVNPAGGTVTHSWSISGSACATIQGSTTGASVTVVVNCPGGGSFTLTDNITRDGCPGQCSVTIPITPCPPLICVTKEIACYLGSNVCSTFSKLATGVQGDTQDPAFCYRIAVSNCGPVALNNVTVIDDKYGNLTTNFPCIVGGSLAVGASCTYTFRVELDGASLPNHISVITNTVTATGQSAFTGQQVSAQDHAVAQIIPAGIACQQLYTVDGGQQVNCVSLDLSDTSTHVVVTYVKIINTGLADLLNVHIANNGANPCAINANLASLPSGTMVTIPLCTNSAYTCNDVNPSSVTVTSSEFAYAAVTELCAHDINGLSITVHSECPGCVQCTQPNACRVTGGGRQDGPALTYPDNVRYVTHGGQVGAPVGNRVCAVDTNIPNFFLGNPCIHGRWTHVRHDKGGLEGNFHARFYDTLDCACLDATAGPGGVYGPGTVVDGVCNPGDKVAGPEPRRAPANKIVFTGVGDWADPNGRRAPRATLFRVDIEDRSEPGGTNKNPPADRYRIRIWVLSASELAQLNGAGPDRYLLNFRNAISACNGINVRDGVDVPNGTPVFGHRAPDIDDGGELERGNHQIHPMIKNCDPLNPTGPGLAKP